MLSTEEKLKIELTELYRLECKAKLTKQNTNPFFLIINSPILIWFLSTIVVGLITFLYTENQNETKKQYQKELKINQLDVEIKSRLIEAELWLTEATGAMYLPDSMISLEFMKDVPKRIFEIPNKNDIIFPEYSERSLKSLMIELESYLEDEEKRDVSRAIKKTQTAERFWIIQGVSFENRQNFSEDITEIKDERWSIFSNLRSIKRDIDKLNSLNDQ